jgi:Lipoprotein LpqB beta-propeller domain
MRRHRLVALTAAALVATVTLGGCGMPAQTRVQDNGAGLSGGATSGSETGTSPPGRLASGVDPARFVLHFLSAPAGDIETAAQRQREFMGKGAAKNWRPEPQRVINVIRYTGQPRVVGGEVVLTGVQHVGLLTDFGRLDPPVQEATEYRFKVGNEDDQGNGLFILEAPRVILMTADALKNYYEPRPIYFWDIQHTGLVPDVRYLPRSLPRVQRPNYLIDAMIAGPSHWLRPAVDVLPPDAERKGNVADPGDGPLVVNLNAAALTEEEGEGEGEVPRLGSQLRWSLWPDWQGDLDLRIDGQPNAPFRGENFLADNPVVRPQLPAQAFCVFQGSVRGRDAGDGLTPSVPIGDSVNRGVRSAALARGRTSDQFVGALVRTTINGRLQLSVGAGDDYKAVGGSFGEMSRPTWLAGSAEVGLVVADGRLYQFRRDSLKLAAVALTGSAGRTTAVAAPPDGRRVAYVRGGHLYVAVFGGQSKLAPPVEVPSPLRSVTAVAWSGQDRLVIAGRRADRTTALVDVSVDGGYLGTEVTLPAGVSHLVAYPEKPNTASEDRRVMYQLQNGRSYESFFSQEEIIAADVAGIDPAAQRSAIRPAAPFFLE